MPTAALRQITAKQDNQALRARLEAEAARVQISYKASVIDFMVMEGIQDFSELDYATRKSFEAYLEGQSGMKHIRHHLLAFDKLKQHVASVTKRGDSYVVRYIYVNDQGERCAGWETFKTEEGAKSRKIAIESELRNGTFLVPNQITVRELFEQWLPIQSRKHKWAPATYVGTVAQAQNLIFPYIGNLEVQKVRSYHIEKLYSLLSQTPCGLYSQGERQELSEKQKKRLLSGTTIHEVHTLLRTVFSYAVEWNIIHKSPVPRDGPKMSTEERKIWDENTVSQALKEIDDPMLHLAVHLTFVGALRQGELLGLTPEDLNYEAADGRGTISISKTLQRISKEALTKVRIDESYRVLEDKRECSSTSLVLKPTKTKKSRRVIFMTGPLKEELKSWIARLEREEKNAGKSYRNSGMLFRLPNGAAVESTFLRKRFEKWQEEHPGYEKIVFHGLRHPYVKHTTKKI